MSSIQKINSLPLETERYSAEFAAQNENENFFNNKNQE